ncbi:MAG: helix-turn-helix transcriptional regulator [Gammaproteobacteria bacterium]|nr:helix-turn-helix transcriptional regulator [Gammaproteobacteria bacterium]
MKIHLNDALGFAAEQDQNKTNTDLQYDSLTSREKECIYWLFNGKTVPEIALILNASKRTIEKHIISIKNKFACYTLFQLGNSANPIRHKILQFYKQQEQIPKQKVVRLDDVSIDED